MSTVKRAGPPRLILTLGVAGLLSGLVLVTVYLATQPLILQNQAEALEAAIYRVVPGADTRKAFVVEDGQLVEYQGEEGVPSGEVIFGAYDGDELLGYAIPWEGAGFQDTIRLIYGYDPDSDQITGMEVLDSRETPGLGDKIIKDESFVNEFKGLAVDPAVEAVADGDGPNEVDTISGATISSKAVVSIINEANQRYLDVIRSRESGSQSSGGGEATGK